MKLGCCNIVLLVFGVLGAILLIVGCILGFGVIPPIIEDQIIETVQLIEDSEQYERWKVTPMAFQFKVHIFEVANVDDVMNGAKPRMEQKGPYIYKEYRKKENIMYNKEDDTFEYEQNLRFEFDADASHPHTEDETVTVLNVAFQGVLQISEEQGVSSAVGVSWDRMFPDTTSLFHTINVREFLFGGYRFCDPQTLTGAANTIPRVACSRVRASASASQTLVVEDDNTVVFTFFKHKEVHNDGPYVIKAGIQDVHQLGAIQSWKGLKELGMWGESEDNKCNTVRGRDSAIYPPFNNDSSVFDIFNSDICRIVKLRTSHLSTFNGIDGYIAKLDDDMLSNKDGSECYCTQSIRNLDGKKECFPEGFGDLLTCTGAPVVMSFPHFLRADETYSSTVDGLSPNADQHETIAMIEPGTGSPLRGAKRMQFNMVIRPIDEVPLTEDITPAMLPILWVEESVELADDLVQKLKDDYLSKLTMVDALTYSLIGIGAFLMVVGFGGFLLRRCC